MIRFGVNMRKINKKNETVWLERQIFEHIVVYPFMINSFLTSDANLTNKASKYRNANKDRHGSANIKSEKLLNVNTSKRQIF